MSKSAGAEWPLGGLQERRAGPHSWGWRRVTVTVRRRFGACWTRGDERLSVAKGGGREGVAELEKWRQAGTERFRLHFRRRTVGTQTVVEAGGLWRRARVWGH